MGNPKQWRREYPRVSRAFVVRFRKKAETVRDVGTIRNISEGGCYFGTGKQITPGDVLDLEIQFPAIPNPMSFVGEVTRCEAGDTTHLYFVGVKFLEMDQAKKDEFVRAMAFFIKKQGKERESR